MYLSQSKAAKVAGVSRGTIANRIDDGKLSKHPEGIEISELMRCFDYITQDDIDRVARPVNKSELLSNSSSALSNSDSFMKSRLEAADENTEWLRGLVEQQRAQLRQKEKELTEMLERVIEKDNQIASLSDKVMALLPAPDVVAPRKKFLGIF